MNFEFKSTFNNTAKKNTLILISMGIRSVFLLVRNNFITLLAFNISVFCLAGYLYSENYFIPAVYGSKPSAETWITLFQTLGFAWLLSTAFAFSELVFQIARKYQLVTRFNNLAVGRITSPIRSAMLLLLLLVTMLIQISNYTFCFGENK